MLHLNELSFRHLFDVIDEKLHALYHNATFAGEIGKQMKEKVHQFRPVAFQAIPGDIVQMSPEAIKDFNSDQRYLDEICQSVSTGSVLQELSIRSPAALYHARLLTRANRILCMYIGSGGQVTFKKELGTVTSYFAKK